MLTMGLSSCGSMKTVKNTPSVGAEKAPRPSTISKMRGFGLASLFGTPVEIVAVRDKDLKELPLGRERALAYEKERKSGFLASLGGVNFIQPALPEPGGIMDGSLLPPKTP